VKPIEAHAADRAWAPGDGGSKHGKMQSNHEYTKVKNGAPQPTSRLKAPTTAICLSPLLMMNDAAASDQNSVAGEGSLRGQRGGGHQVFHRRPRRARRRRTTRADNAHRDIEELHAA